MRELEVRLMGQSSGAPAAVKIDGKPVKFKKNKFGNLVYNHQTENETAKIEIFRQLDVGGVVWFFTQLFFFIISIFGIFDVHRRERCAIIDYSAEFTLKETNKLTLRINPVRENAQAVSVETDAEATEISNVYYVDNAAKKTLKLLLITKIVLAVAIIATVIAVLAVKL